MPRLAVVVPAGPADDICDTLASVAHWTTPDRVIVVVDDTGRPSGADEMRAVDPSVVVVPAPTDAPGAQGGLWVKLSHGYRRAAAHGFDVLLRLDADALVTGPGPEDDAGAAFRRSPELGMLGSYRVTCTGARRDFSPAASIVRRESGPLGLRRPHVRRTLRSWQAACPDYVVGEHPLGGAYFHSRAVVEALLDAGMLNRPELARSGLGEDHLFALATRAAGFQIGDFTEPGQPIGIAWKGLPQSPERLLADRRKIVHSVRSWENWSESEIRAYFRRRRN